MNISGIGTSSSSLYSYQWNNQQLQESTTTSSASSSSSSSAYGFQGTSSVSSMVELATYAMEAMGVSGSEKVTFSQIEKYKEELEEAFSKNLNASIQSLNIDENASFTVNLATDGTIKVDSSHEDSAKIQAYFDVYPEMANNLRKQLDAAGFENNVQFSISANGAISGVSTTEDPEITELSDSTLGTDILNGIQESIEEEAVEIQPFSLVINNGSLQFDDEGGEHQHSAAIIEYLAGDPALAQEIQAAIDAKGITGEVRIHVNSDGKVTVEQVPSGNTNTEDEAENTAALQDFLTDNNVGQSLKDGLASVGIDPNIDFRLTVEDGKVVVNSSHPDAVKVQALIDADEQLSKDYLQIDALAGLDAARKSMQVEPSAMRTRIQMESMVAWWANTGTSSIGSFSGGDLSSFTGVNSVV